MSVIRQSLNVIKRIAIVVGIAIAFSLGLLGAIYLSLRSSETRVPDIVGKDRSAAENTISDAGLNFRVRAERATSEAKPGTVLIQLPHAGEIVKVGQTVAVDISRPTKEGEVPTQTNANENTKAADSADSSTVQENNSSAANNSNGNKKKPANRNANANDNLNGNLNGNANRLANRNQNQNVNRATNVNTNSNLAPAHTDTNTAPVNRRPPVTAPTP